MRSIILFLTVISGSQVCAQAPGTIPQAFVQSGDSLTSQLLKGHEDELAIFNGRQHFGYPVALEGHAYYPVDKWETGSVKYEDNWYHNIHLMYDAFADVVIVQHPSGMSMNLNSDRVQGFKTATSSFVNVKVIDPQADKSAFYQQLVIGELGVLVKRTKKLDEKINGLQVEQRYLTSDHYYSYKDGQLRPVRKEKDIMNLVGERKQTIAQQLRSNGIRYKKSREVAMITIAHLYNNQSIANP